MKIYLFIIVFLISNFTSAQMRVWEDKNGLQIKGEFVREIFGSIEIRRPNGFLHNIAIEDLSEEDESYVRTLIPPDVSIDVKTSKKAKERNERFIWAHNDINIVSAETIIRKKSKSPYRGTLKAEVYLIGKEVVTDRYTLVDKTSSRIKFTDQNKGRVIVNSSGTFRVYEEYNNLEIRGWKYEGYLVVITDPIGNILTFKSDLNFLTDLNIPNIRKFHVGIFFDDNCVKKSIPRPRPHETHVHF